MSWIASRISATRSTLSISRIGLHQVFPRSKKSPHLHHCGLPRRSTTVRYCHSPSLIMEASPPKDTVVQTVQHAGKEYQAVREGRAYILNPPAQAAASQGTKKTLQPEDESQSVFYNPIQQFNRDLSVLAIKVFGEHVLALKKVKNEKRKRKNKGDENKGKKRKRDEDGPTEDQNTKENGEAKGIEVECPAAAPHPELHTTPPSFTVLDALSATGLRALRYASEIPFLTRVVANDLSPSAIQSMKTNVEYNGLQKLIQPNHGDARIYMYSLLNPASSKNHDSGKFDVIDLDPYGTAVPFLDGAVQGVKDGGLLCVTCTDAAIWASYGYPEKSYSLYGGIPVRGSHSHEGGLRLILHALATSAAKYGLAIEPLLSLSIDFYARVFVRVHQSPAEVKFISGKTMFVYNCDSGCGAWTTQPLTQTKRKEDKKGNPFYHFGSAQGPTAGPRCEECGFKTHVAGPMWAGPLHNPHFIQRILDALPKVDRDTYKTVDRIEGMLTTALEEDLSLDVFPNDQTPPPLPPSSASPAAAAAAAATEEESLAIIPRVDPALREPYPFYFSLSALSRVLHTATIPVDSFRGALRHLGYRSSRSHAKPSTMRTDAPWSVIWEIMREWVRQKSPIRQGALKPTTAGAAIMSKGQASAQIPALDEDQQFSQLKRDLIAAAESGRDLTDLVTKIEAALYRNVARQAPGEGESEFQANGWGGESQTAANIQPEATNPQPRIEVVFDEALGQENRPKKRLVRYQINPRANWGPLNRASGST